MFLGVYLALLDLIDFFFYAKKFIRFVDDTKYFLKFNENAYLSRIINFIVWELKLLKNFPLKAKNNVLNLKRL